MPQPAIGDSPLRRSGDDATEMPQWDKSGFGSYNLEPGLRGSGCALSREGSRYSSVMMAVRETDLFIQIDSSAPSIHKAEEGSSHLEVGQRTDDAAGAALVRLYRFEIWISSLVRTEHSCNTNNPSAPLQHHHL